MIMATNHQDTLDPALIRPRCLDRKIELSLLWKIVRYVLSFVYFLLTPL